MTPTRRPPGCTFWPIRALRSCRSWSLAAKREPGKDAGSVRSQRLRARPRTPHGDALQRAGGREVREWRAASRGDLLSLLAGTTLRLLLSRRFRLCRRLFRRGRGLRGRLGGATLRPGDLRRPLEHDRDVTCPLEDAVDASAGTGLPSLQRRSFVRIGLDDHEP